MDAGRAAAAASGMTARWLTPHAAADSATSARNASSRVRRAAAGGARVVGHAPRLAVQLIERALGDEPAVRDDADAVGHALGDFQDVRGHDDGAASAYALAQHVLDLARGAGIEPGQRLVENDDARVVHQRAGERHLLAHALGKALAALIGMRRRDRANRAAPARASAPAPARRPTARRRIPDIPAA